MQSLARSPETVRRDHEVDFTKDALKCWEEGGGCDLLKCAAGLLLVAEIQVSAFHTLKSNADTLLAAGASLEDNSSQSFSSRSFQI